MGPGQYDPDRVDGVTKPKIANINLGSSPSRGSFIRKDEANLGPGQYDDGSKEFGRETKTFTIGEKRTERMVETMGPGQYQPERADALTKSKVKTVNISSSPARPASFAKRGDVDVAPGQYDDGIRFNTGTKQFTIREKRPERVVETMGPGTYDPDRADGVTKPKTANINMGTSPSRGSMIRKDDANIGPGQYDDGKSFGKETKTFTIGEKRYERVVETMGPGQYSPERADAMTK